MSITRTILYKSFVKPFYRQHAGFFIFIFILLFGAVGVVDGAGLMVFHFSLIQGMLKNIFLFLLVLVLWILYAKKAEQFVTNTIKQPEFLFLQHLSLMNNQILLRELIWVQFLLFIPITFYITLILATGIYLHAFISCVIVLIFLVSIHLIPAIWYRYKIQNAGIQSQVGPAIFSKWQSKPPYFVFFLRYIRNEKKLLYAGIKIYCCLILYLMIVNQTRIEYDLRMIIIFFSMGILGHGLLVHQLRDLEEQRFKFYRVLSCGLITRIIQYVFLYVILLIPEFITLSILTPAYLLLKDAFLFAVFSFSILLFLNSILFIRFFRMNAYLKIVISLFLLIFLSVLTATVPWLCILLLFSAVIIFFKRYYQFELTP